MDSIIALLNEKKIKHRLNCTLAELSTFKVGGAVELVLYPKTAEECRYLLSLAKQLGKEIIYLGNGSNILGSDKGCRAWIIKTDLLDRLEVKGGDSLVVGAGVKGVKVSSFAAQNNLSGVEFLHGIPGSMGGFVFMNAGAYDGSVDQILSETKYMDDAGEIHVLKGEKHDFGYRKSFFMQHPEFLILETTLKLVPAENKVILDKINDLQQRRKEKQPLEYPSAGSTFKRPEGYFAGKLIQDAGLKGYTIGGAQVSEKHAGFIINKENASGSDVRMLISHVQKVVKEKFDVELKCEVRYIGEE